MSGVVCMLHFTQTRILDINGQVNCQEYPDGVPIQRQKLHSLFHL